VNLSTDARVAPPAPDTSFNRKAAEIFRHCAELLRQQRANPFRVNAYLRAAKTLDTLPTDAREILHASGIKGLLELPHIGAGLASAIDEIARTGTLAQLDRLRGSADPEAMLRVVPGVGPTLARAIHDELQIDSLEELEVAAHDGRLETLRGIGPRRAAAIRASLATLLGRARPRHGPDGPALPVATLLAVDAEYRRAAAAGTLPTIAPRRFNPEHNAWLPILHTERDGWHFTALFSNTARAHELGRTNDWVVIYFYDGDHREGQYTVVTETHGPLSGQRVVRGREAESAGSVLSAARDAAHR
jgi:DNA polymerase (family 10)